MIPCIVILAFIIIKIDRWTILGFQEKVNRIVLWNAGHNL